MRAPAKTASEEDLYAKALRALARRAYSAFEMREYLAHRSEDEALAGSIVARLRQEKLIDDARYAADFVRARARVRRQGPHRIRRELRARGVAETLAEEAIAHVFAETDQAAAVRTVIQRRLRAVRGEPDEKRLASIYRALLRAGFETDLIRRELRAAARTQATQATLEDVGGEGEE
jgi:regulatory protein